MIDEALEDTLRTAATIGLDRVSLRYIHENNTIHTTATSPYHPKSLYFGRVEALPSSDIVTPIDPPDHYHLIIWNPLSQHEFISQFGPLAIQSLMDRDVLGGAYADRMGISQDADVVACAYQTILAQHRSQQGTPQSSRWLAISTQSPRLYAGSNTATLATVYDQIKDIRTQLVSPRTEPSSISIHI